MANLLRRRSRFAITQPLPQFSKTAAHRRPIQFWTSRTNRIDPNYLMIGKQPPHQMLAAGRMATPVIGKYDEGFGFLPSD